MDERQTKIIEGAGLEESRINEELIEFLNKWSFPVLLVIALISGGYFAKNMYDRAKISKRDDAFAQLGTIESTASPSVYSLTEIADQYEGVGSVSELARLRAADVHLRAVRSGIDPADGETVLSEADRDYHLDRAEGLYRRVLEKTESDANRTLIAANAAFGLAAVAETRGDADAARAGYERAKMLADRAGFAPLARVADRLASNVGLPMPTLYGEGDLPRLPHELAEQGFTEEDLQNLLSSPEFLQPPPDAESDPTVPPSDQPADLPAVTPDPPAEDPEDG